MPVAEGGFVGDSLLNYITSSSCWRLHPGWRGEPKWYHTVPWWFRTPANQLRLVVEIPLFTRVLAPSKRWLASGFLNHQPYQSNSPKVRNSPNAPKGGSYWRPWFRNSIVTWSGNPGGGGWWKTGSESWSGKFFYTFWQGGCGKLT